MKTIIKFIVCLVLAYASTSELAYATWRNGEEYAKTRAYLIVVAVVSGLVLGAATVGLADVGKVMSFIMIYAFVSSLTLVNMNPGYSMITGDLMVNPPVGSLAAMVPVAAGSIYLTLKAFKSLVDKDQKIIV
jgi:hypothetical protein